MHKYDLTIIFIMVSIAILVLAFSKPIPKQELFNCNTSCWLDYCDINHCISFPIIDNPECTSLKRFCIRQSDEFCNTTEYIDCSIKNTICNFDNLSCRWIETEATCSCTNNQTACSTSEVLV